MIVEVQKKYAQITCELHGRALFLAWNLDNVRFKLVNTINTDHGEIMRRNLNQQVDPGSS